jgi:hypothetical protein
MAELPSYVVIFVDWDGSVIDTQTVEYGGSATAPEVSEREGYTFTGWDKAFDNVTGDLTVTAQYEAIDYALIVKYEYSDGSEAAATYTATLNMGDEYNVASPEITGHTPDQVTVSGTMPAKDVTVTVVYTVNQYTITFNSAGGSAIVPITLDYGAVVIAPEDPTREGYTFAGWEPELPATMPAQDIEVTAQWTINKYTVTFVDWDGSVIDTQTVEHGGSATAPEVSEREGYTFNGWDKAFDNVTGDLTVTAQYEAIDYALIVKYEYSDGSEAAATYTATLNMGDEYNVASPEITGHTPDQVTVSGTMPAKDVTVTVVYTVNQYTITFNSAGGSAIVPITLDYGAVVIAPEDPTREGYTFAGWEPELPATMPAQDIEVTAQWTINKYTVTFVDWDGSVIDTQTVEHGGSATAPEVSEREGYTFNGWDKAFDNVTGDLTVTAQYTINTYTFILNYDESEGTVVGKIDSSDYTFTIGGDGNALPLGVTIELTATAAEGFTFVGWANTGNEIISYDSTYIFELLEDVTITPLFYRENEAEVARIGATGYETLEAALAEAVSGDIVILLKDYALTGDATVPDGVLLLLPCGPEDFTGYIETGFNPNGTSTSKGDLSVLYRTLTIPDGVTVTIEGTVMVNAVTGRPGGGHYDQDITGGYSQIMLEGNIIVKEDGLLDVFGRVKGSGTIEALDGGSVGDLYVVKHWRGGTQALFTYLMGIYPFNEYELHNIEANIKINSGASYYGNVKMYADNSYHYTRFYQFDQAEGLIKMAPGAFALKTYDSGNGQTTVVINGGAEEIGGSMTISGVPATTKDFFFPVDGHITFVLENGEYAVNNLIKFLPGSVLTIGEEATLTVKPGAQLIMYEEFIDEGNLSGTEYPLRDPARFNLDGTLVIEGAFGGLIDAGISAQVVIGNDAVLEVSSREAKGRVDYSQYDVTTNLDIDFAPDAAWYYYPNGENSDVAIPVLDSYEGIDYINLNLNPASYRGHTFIVDEYTSINYTLTYTAGANGSILGDVTQTVKHGSDGTAVEAVADEGYHFEKWSDGSTDNPRTDTNVTADISVAAEFAINTYTVTFLDHDGNVIDTQTVEHGGSAVAPTAPTIEGYTFTGWDVKFDNVTENMTVKAQYEETPVPNTIEIIGPDFIEIKLSGNVTEIYTAIVKDQNGNEISEESVIWALKETVAGVSVDANSGQVTVANTTIAESFTIVAVSKADQGVKAEKTVTLTKERNNDATLSDLMVNGGTVEGFTAETLEYNVKLPAGTTQVPTVAATATDTNATVEITQAASLDGTNNVATVKVTAEDGSTTKTYTITFTIAPNEDQDAPTGLEGLAPTTEDNNDGKIVGTTTAMEYKLASAEDSAYTTCGNGETTNLAPGSYYVRYAAKPGYNASAAVKVIVPEYQPPVVVAEIDKVEAENGKVTITLKEKPTKAPTAEDFIATIAIDGGEATGLTLSDFAIDEDGVTITFTFEAVEQTEAEQSVVVAVKLGEGEAVAAAAFTVEAEEIDTEAAKQEFLDAVTDYNPDSDIYQYSFDGKDLDIKFDFTEYKGDDGTIGVEAIMAVVEGAGEFLTAIFDIGKAQQIVIDMNNQEIIIDHNSDMDEIIKLAGAVFDVDVSSGFNDLFEPVMNFLGMGSQPNLKVTADFTMTVTNQDGIEFVLENLIATFTNNTEELNEEEITETTVTIDETQFNDDEEAIEEAEIEPIEVTDEVSVEGGEEVKEETENVEDNGEENQETPVVEEEDNEGVNDEEELENGGEEDAV